MALLATTASASSLTLAEVGGVDTLIASADVNSGDPNELAWISQVTGVPLANLTYSKIAASGGDKWQPISGTDNLFAFDLGSEPTWFLVKTGAGGSFDHYLYENVADPEWAVIDFTELGFDDINIGKVSHVAIASDPSSEQTAPVPEPASLTLLGLGLSASAAAVRRRRRKA